MQHHPVTPARSVPLTAAARLWAIARSVWRTYRRNRRLQATVDELHRLNDHTLRDIGLERHSIEDAVRDAARRRCLHR